MKKQFILIAFVLISLFSFSQVPSYVPTNGLIGWWPFNGNANDESGNGNNGTVIGATLTNDRFGNMNSAYNFDYSSVGFGTQTDEIYIPYQPSLNSPSISISVWVYQRQYFWSGNPNPPMSTIAARFQYGYSNPNGQVWMLNSGTGGIESSFSGAPAITLNNWTHIVTTFENGVGKIYINGTLMSTQSNLSPLNVSGNSGISIGESNQANGYWWPTDGIIDDFALFNRALTQQEITNLYTSSVPPTCSMIASATSVCSGSQVTLTASSLVSNTAICSGSSLPASLQSGLLEYYSFCGNANSSLNNGNNGTVNGSVLTQDALGNNNSAYAFNGNNSSITLPNDFCGGQDLTTASFRVKFKVNSNGNFGIWNKDGSWKETAIYTTSSGALGIFWAYPNQYNAIETPAGTIAINTWYDAVILFDGANSKIFLNGAQVTGATISIGSPAIGFSSAGTCGSGINRFGFQKASCNPQSYFNGVLDEFMIYNRVITNTEIQQLYNQGQTTYLWSPGGATTPSITVSPTQTTMYTCTVTTNGQGCSASETITVNPLPNVNAGSDQSICLGSSATLSATGATTYSWNNNVSNGVAFTPSVTTTYTVTGTNVSTGCSNTDQVVVNVNAIPTVNAGADQTICAGTAVTLSGSGATTYSWNNNVSNAVAFTPLATTTYTVTGTNASTGCSNTDQLVVNVNALPTVNAGADQTICAGTAVTLSGSGATTYTWNNNVNNGVAFTPSATTTYTVTGTDANGCTNVDQVTVNINALPTVNAGSDIAVCQNDSVILTASGTSTYSWDNGVQNGVAFLPIQTNSFVVTGTDSQTSCQNSDTVVVTVHALPTVDAGQDLIVCKGDTIMLSGSGASSYIWNNNVIDGQTFNPISTQTYIVEGTDNNNCVNSDSVTVTVNEQTFSSITESAIDSYTLNGITYTQSGTYTQVLTNASGCDSTITLNLSLNFTGIDELENELIVSPNPTQHTLMISSKIELYSNFSLFDPQGRIVMQGKLQGKETLVDLSHLSIGNYMLQLESGSKPIKLMKL